MFDLGGVLVENTMFEELPELIDGDIDDSDLKAKWLQSQTAREFELGNCSPEAFAIAIVEEFQLSTSPAEFLEAFSGWPKGFYPSAPDLLADLRKRYVTGCLSNSNELHWTDHVTSHFDHCYSSHILKKIKPDAAVFEAVTDDIGCQPSDVVFFDDSRLNVDAAQAFGWVAHLTVGYAALNRVLSETGITR